MTPSHPIPLCRPSITDEDRRAVAEVLEGTALAWGPCAEELETAFSDFLGSPCALVSSGTAALYLALRALGVDGGSVITPSYGFVASAHAIRLAGATPRFADVSSDTLGLTAESIDAVDAPDVRAILPVHPFGTPIDMTSIGSWAKDRGVPVIEDACEALGSIHAGRPVGTWGEAGAFAFYPNKQITMGEGGLVVARDAATIDTIRSQRNQGRVLGGARFAFEGEGFNFRLTEMQAALGLSQFRRLEELNEARTGVARRYEEALRGIDGLELLPDPPAGDHRSWFAFPVWFRSPEARDRAAERLGEEGIETAPYFVPIHHSRPYDAAPRPDGGLPVTESRGARGLAIPFFPELPPSDQDRVIERVTVAARL